MISAEHCSLIQLIAKDSPEIEYVRGDPDDFSEEKKKAIEVLSQLNLVFPENERYSGKTIVGSTDDRRLVALKKSKVNAFNDRDGILFYALREA